MDGQRLITPTDRQAFNWQGSKLLNDQELIRWAQFGRTIAGLIHELSTPLTAATLTLDQLQSETQNHLIKQARQDLRQLEHYIVSARQQLCSESRPKAFSINTAIRQVVKLLSARAFASDIKLAVNLQGSIRMHGDLVKFHQVIGNLINNAIDACGSKAGRGLVSIETNLLPGNIVILVRDNGTGIARSDMSKIFEPFYSTKSAQGRGLGIGLDLVKRYVEYDFKGTIMVRSRIDYGTCFILTLPLRGIGHKANFKPGVVQIK